MSETEWLGSANPIQMLHGLGGERSLRLFSAACCRRIWHLLADERSRMAVQVAELYADAEATEEELAAADDAALAAQTEAQAKAYERIGPGVAGDSATAAAAAAGNSVAPRWAFDGEQAELFYMADNPAEAVGLADADEEGRWRAKAEEFARQADLLRDIFGNPFRSAAFDPAWQTPLVVSLALSAYEERHLPSGELDPERLAVLADALEEAGGAGEVLSHLRGAGPHVLGCWVIDSLIGRC